MSDDEFWRARGLGPRRSRSRSRSHSRDRRHYREEHRERRDQDYNFEPRRNHYDSRSSAWSSASSNHPTKTKTKVYFSRVIRRDQFDEEVEEPTPVRISFDHNNDPVPPCNTVEWLQEKAQVCRDRAHTLASVGLK